MLGAPPGSPAAVTRVGALVEGPGFYPYLTGRDNLRVLCRYRGLGDRAADAALTGSASGREAQTGSAPTPSA